jgi:FAD/FMN-containing dehydrogenase
MASAKNAIQIDFRNLNQVRVSDDGKTAIIGGGATVKTVVDELAKAGKRTGKLCA